MMVVTGTTGNVGRVVAETLVRAGEVVVGFSRGTSAGTVPDGVRLVRGDLAEPETLRSAAEGAEALFLMVSGAGAHLNPPRLLGAVRAAGVQRVVLLSSQAAGTRPDSLSHEPLRALEDEVRKFAGTVLRPGGFAGNALAWAGSVRSDRKVHAPFADVGLPVIDPEDIGAVAAAALTDESHTGRILELTGPELSTPRERAACLGRVLGCDIRFVEKSPEEAKAQMLAFMPEPVVAGTLDILGRPTQAEQRISPVVEDVLGRPPRTFEAWAFRNAQAFR